MKLVTFIDKEGVECDFTCSKEISPLNAKIDSYNQYKL